MANNGILRRLQQLGRVIGHRARHTIVIKVPTLLTPIAGSVECASTVAPETRAEADELLEVVGVDEEDFIIEVAHFYEAAATNGHTEPVPIPAP